jgi:hypothetical protein
LASRLLLAFAPRESSELGPMDTAFRAFRLRSREDPTH